MLQIRLSRAGPQPCRRRETAQIYRRTAPSLHQPFITAIHIQMALRTPLCARRYNAESNSNSSGAAARLVSALSSALGSARLSARLGAAWLGSVRRPRETQCRAAAAL